VLNEGGAGRDSPENLAANTVAEKGGGFEMLCTWSTPARVRHYLGPRRCCKSHAAGPRAFHMRATTPPPFSCINVSGKGLQARFVVRV
jgi:hypothetical protein